MAITKLTADVIDIDSLSQAMATESFASELIENTQVAGTSNAGATEGSTVFNALQLGGIPASQYFTDIEGASIKSFAENCDNVYADQISLLRDELYKLKAELFRNGYVRNGNMYAGFNDYFKVGQEKYINTAFECSSISGTKIYMTNTNHGITKNDYIAISAKNALSEDCLPIFKVASVSGTEVTLNKTTNGYTLNSNSKYVYKTIGGYSDNSFGFFGGVKTQFVDKPSTFIRDDFGTASTKLLGSAITIEIDPPSFASGKLIDISIAASKTGNPGDIGVQLKDGDTVLLTTTCALISGSIIKINIIDNLGETAAPMIDPEKVYTLVLTPNANDTESNCYNIYNFKTINSFYFSMTTQKVNNASPVTLTEGVYAAKINLPSICESNRARLNLEFAAETIYTAKDSIVATAGQAIAVNNTTFSQAGPSTVFSVGDYIVCNKTIVKVTNVVGATITVDKAVALNAGEKLYRIGYKPQIKHSASNIAHELLPIAVMPKAANESDMIIFEAQIKDESSNIINITNAELQIYWKSDSTTAGILKDINLVFDARHLATIN